MQPDAGQYVVAPESFWGNRDDQPAIGVVRVAARQAHAVGAEIVGGRDTGNNVAAGAHAKCEEVVLAARDQRVVGVAERFFKRRTAILHAIDQFLRMLDAHAELERFLFERHATMDQHGIRVAGAVADGQNHHITSDRSAGRLD